MKKDILKGILLYSLLCCFINVTGCVIHISGYSPPRSRYERTVELSRPMPAGTLFSGKSNDGWITITGGDVTECSVAATIIARAASDEKARRIAEESMVKLEKSGSKLTVKLEKPVLWTNESVDIQFMAMLPKDCNVEVGTDDGDITTENINGNIEIKTDDGKVSLSKISGDVRVTSNDGSVTIQDVNTNDKLRKDDGWIDIQTDDGRIILSRIIGNIKVRSNDGSSRIEDVAGDVNVQSDDGRITVIYREGAGGVFDISMVTDDGAVDFKAPANFSANVEVITDGSVYTDLPVKVLGKLGKNGIKGIIGTGEGRLYIKTDDGSVRIR
jgi:translation initiation factor IF-1